MTPNFTKTTIPEKEALGEKLAKKRVALGFDVKDAERATKIRVKYLTMIENSDWNKLPPDVYVYGFLKNYANFLKLDPDKVVKLYMKERGLKEKIKKVKKQGEDKPKPKKLKKPKIIITPKRIALFAVIFGALTILGYIGWQVSILAAPPKLEVKSPTDNTRVEESSTVVEGKTDAGADVFINDVAIGVDPEGNFKEKISLQDGVNLIKISAKNKLAKTTQTTKTVLAKLTPIVQNTQPKLEGLEMRLDIGPGTSALYIEVDGRPISEKNAVMLPGSSQTVKAKEKIVVTASDGGSVRVFLNGKDMGALGKNGEKIKNRTFDKSSI